MKLLIIDDEENMCHMLRAITERHGYVVTTANNGKEGLALAEEGSFDFILCDIRMPVMDGMTFLEKGRGLLSETTVIMMSAFGSIDTALEAMKAGAYDFISKPFKSDEVILTLKKAEEREALKAENKRLREEINQIKTSKTKFGRMVSVSAGMKEIFSLCLKVGSYDTTVLITGESGTGKELVARAVHEHSKRKDGKFVAVNCGSIPENLIESELFGHVRGAFTGADAPRKGLFEEADQATLFLDEIGELPLAMQVKLLRVLQEQEIRPVGASKEKKVNVRVLAATARDLNQSVKNGTFREDLFYRLNVLPIKIPPLRERKEDIPVLCQHFVKKFNSELASDVIRISPDAMKCILEYEWPGNVRELENAIQRGVVVADAREILPENLPDRVQAGGGGSSSSNGFAEKQDILSLKVAQKRMESGMIARVLEKCGGNKSRAAEILEISYPSLLSKIKFYGIE